jgi:Holliday junction resolvase RusA-like endonuclease
MKKWAFILDITGAKADTKVREAVQQRAEEVVKSIQASDKPSVFRASIAFYQASNRWLNDNPMIPREDRGRDLDNLIKAVFDGLGPIIGWRQKHKRDAMGTPRPVHGEHRGVRDAQIVEVVAKKVNSGSKQEFLSIEIEATNS